MSVSEPSEDPRPTVVVVTGATACGKSEFAVRLAVAIGGEVVGADSRQVYKYMDAATAKPSAQQRAAAAHHMIDVVEPDRAYDAVAWRDGATVAIEAILRRGAVPIVCGGTGLYIKALLEGIFEGPSADPDYRKAILAKEEREPGSARRRLQGCDPVSAARIHRNDTTRIVRALEVFESTGRPLSAWHAEQAAVEPFQALVVELELAREALYQRIDARAETMCRAGLLEELRELRLRYPADARAFSAIGYKQAGAVLDGGLEREKLAEEVARATRNYAKRQLTWLRGQLRTSKVDAAAPEPGLALAQDFVAKRQGIG